LLTGHPQKTLLRRALFVSALAALPVLIWGCSHASNSEFHAGKQAEAIQDYDKVVALKPDFAGAYYSRAVLHAKGEEYAQALADLKTYEKLGGRPDPGFVESLLRAAKQRNVPAP